MKIILPLLSLLAPLRASAALVSFQYDAMIDATAFGGGAQTPLSVVYSYDSRLPEGYTGTGEEPDTSSFGPVNVRISLGHETVTSTAGVLILNNNNGGGIAGFPEQSDSYQLYIQSERDFSGELLGMKPFGFLMILFDTDRTMFDGKPQLPTGAEFAAGIDYQGVWLYLPAGDGLAGVSPLAPFTLKTIPEPSAPVLCALALGALGRPGRRRTSPPARTEGKA